MVNEGISRRMICKTAGVFAAFTSVMPVISAFAKENQFKNNEELLSKPNGQLVFDAEKSFDDLAKNTQEKSKLKKGISNINITSDKFGKTMIFSTAYLKRGKVFVDAMYVESPRGQNSVMSISNSVLDPKKDHVERLFMHTVVEKASGKKHVELNSSKFKCEADSPFPSCDKGSGKDAFDILYAIYKGTNDLRDASKLMTNLNFSAQIKGGEVVAVNANMKKGHENEEKKAALELEKALKKISGHSDLQPDDEDVLTNRACVGDGIKNILQVKEENVISSLEQNIPISRRQFMAQVANSVKNMRKS